MDATRGPPNSSLPEGTRYVSSHEAEPLADMWSGASPFITEFVINRAIPITKLLHAFGMDLVRCGQIRGHWIVNHRAVPRNPVQIPSGRHVRTASGDVTPVSVCVLAPRAYPHAKQGCASGRNCLSIIRLLTPFSSSVIRNGSSF